MGNKKTKTNVLYGFKNNTNGANISVNGVRKPKRTNGVVVKIKKK